MHDRDAGTEGAEKFNQPILDAVGDAQKVVVLEECVEDLLGYAAPSSEKPFKAYQFASAWGPEWKDVPENLRWVMERLFGGYVVAKI